MTEENIYYSINDIFENSEFIVIKQSHYEKLIPLDDNLMEEILNG